MRKNYELTMYMALRRSALQYPKYRALNFEGRFINYRTLLKKIDLYASNIKKYHLDEKGVVTLCLPNVLDAIYLLYAFNKLGVKLSLVHPLMNASILKKTMEKTSSHVVFLLDTMYLKFKHLEDDKNYKIEIIPCDVKKDLSIFKALGYQFINRKKLKYSSSLTTSHLAKGKIETTPVDEDIYNDRFYLQSGGTSGTSKTIALSNLNINSNVRFFFDRLSLDTPKNKYMLAVLPMFHAFGLCMGIHVALYFGGCDMLMPKFSSKKTIKLMKQKHLSFIIGIPLLYLKLIKDKHFDGRHLKSLNVCFVGGDFVDEKIIETFNKTCAKRHSMGRLYVGYGLTEASGVVALNTHADHQDFTVGKLLDNIDVLIKDTNTNKILSDGEDGKIYLSGETLMNHYLNNENDEVFVVHDGKKFFDTGDFGHVSKDRFLVFKQRVKNIIKVKGINVFPQEIEQVLKSDDTIYDCKAIAVKDDEFSHKIVLFIVLNKNTNKTISEKEIRTLVDEKCGRYSSPHIIKFIDKLPYTNIGKVDILKLEEMLKD